ncbi:MAG: hypothetical protein IPP72_17590 [Chitinophagaceae bacterium]|nr:hypothetical protein [Chitinophagaceae bacterium]
MKTGLPFVLLLLFCACTEFAYPQQPGNKTDTIFVVKKKGLLGRLAQSVSTSDTGDVFTEKKINPYFIYVGRTIRNIKIVRLGFERDINDTTKYNNNFGVIVANAFHKKTTANVIANNLFFEAGDRVNPYLMTDNERHLREQPFVQDALIVMQQVPGMANVVDVTVIVKDVFSLGGGLDINSTKRIELELKEENLKGTGSRLTLSTLFDSERRPRMGFGADLLTRNIKGTFINWNVGFKTINDAFSSGKSEESFFYTAFDKPFVSPYIPWMGAVDLSLRKTKNNYTSDSLYERAFKYSYQKFDVWLGYNFGSKRLLRKNAPGRIRNFIAARGIYQHFNDVPGKVLDTFDYRFTNITGILGSFSLFKQNFIRTNFIYGFGRNEDVPEGFRASLVAGWINKKDSLRAAYRSRPYYAFEGQRTHFNTKGFFSSYTFRIGGYVYRGKWEDVDILFDIDHFTKRKKLGSEWYYRQFYSLGITRQINSALSQPLYLNSEFGLPYFSNGIIEADLRCSAKTEAVFYNLHKFWGFRLAPFLFADACIIKQKNTALNKSDLYSALGAGIRTRNESLVFGTIELKGFYFPRIVGIWGI